MKITLELVIIILTSFHLSAQTDTASSFIKAQPYEVIQSPEEKVLRGLISRSIIEKDTSFKWFKANYSLGKTDAAAVSAISQYKDSLQFIVFGGTWCEDTQNLLPQFYRLTDKAAITDSSITLIGVDRKKTTLDNLDKAFHIINVPTFIVMSNGREIGRMVEYGKSGAVDKDLQGIVTSHFK